MQKAGASGMQRKVSTTILLMCEIQALETRRLDRRELDSYHGIIAMICYD